MRNDIEHQQSVAQKVYDYAASKGVDVLLAGGAPSDWYYDRSAKDLDFYCEQHIDLSPISTRKKKTHEYQGQKVFEVITYEIENQVVQMIEYHRPLSQTVDSFDLSPCMISWKSGYFQPHPLFVKGHLKEEIILNRVESDITYLRLNKYKSKTGFKYGIAD